MGIALHRDPLRPDHPSRARICSNRCQDNQHFGIVLVSSESDKIAANECWENGGSSILLQCDLSSPG